MQYSTYLEVVRQHLIESGSALRVQHETELHVEDVVVLGRGKTRRTGRSGRICRERATHDASWVGRKGEQGG